jgi:hypothetical protein
MKHAPGNLFAALASCVALSLAPAAGAADTFSMRYGFAPGSAYDQSFKLALTTSMPSEGISAILKSFVGDVSQVAEVQARLETKSGAGDKSLPFTYRIVKAEGTVTRGGQTKPVPAFAQAAGKPPVEGTVDPERRRVTLALTPDSGLGQIADRFAEAFPQLPDAPLAVGKSFEGKTALALPGASGKEKRVEAVWTYTLKSLDSQEAKFDVVLKIPDATQMAVGQNGTATMAGGGTGRAVWNRAAGAFTSLHLDMNLTVDLDLPVNLTLGGNSGAPGGTKVRTPVTGPLEMTLAPAAPK